MPLPRPATRAPLVRGVARLVLLGVCAVALAAPSAHAQGVLSLEASLPADTPSASASPAPRDDPQEALLAVAACMREHGVDMPDPEFTGDGGLRMRLLGTVATLREDPHFDAARAACTGALEGLTRDGDPARLVALQDQLLAYADCMREHGVDMPDPALGGTGPAALPVWDAADPAAQDAHEACGHLVGGPPDSSEPFEGPDPS